MVNRGSSRITTMFLYDMVGGENNSNAATLHGTVACTNADGDTRLNIFTIL